MRPTFSFERAAPKRALLPALFALLALVSAPLAGCGGGGGGGGGAAAGSSDEVAFGITDAASDQVAVFDVGIQQITLNKRGGGTTTVLPASARVDLAQLVNVTDLVATRRLTAGIYESMDIAIDFTGATLQLSTPTASGPATLRRPDGTALTGVVTERIELGARPLVIPSLRAQLVEIDFNLDGSLEIDEAANVVTVNATILASVEPSGRKPVRVPGLIASVSAANASFVVDFRPRVLSSTHGTFTAQTSAATVFVIDNTVASSQAAGIAALETKLGQRVLVGGLFVGGALQAGVVLAGTTLPQATKDLLNGVIVARSDAAGTATITTRGVFVSLASGGIEVTRTATVVVTASAVAVYSEGRASVGTDADLDIGSTVSFFGTWSAATKTLSDVAVARRLPSSIVGVVGDVSGVQPRNTIQLVRVGPFPAALFQQDSWTAASFGLDTGAFITAGLGTPVRAVGYFAGYPSDGTVDFELTKALVDRSAFESGLGAAWRDPAGAPNILFLGTAGSSSSELLFNFQAVNGCVAAVYDRGLIDRQSRIGTIAYRVEARPGARATFCSLTVVDGSTKTTRSYVSFADFASDVITLAQSTVGQLESMGLVALGGEAVAGNDFQADVVILVVKK